MTEKLRCCVCHSKLGLLPFKCKCSSEKHFCIKHRLPETHNCSFDFHYQKEEIEKQNPIIIAPKVNNF